MPIAPVRRRVLFLLIAVAAAVAVWWWRSTENPGGGTTSSLSTTELLALLTDTAREVNARANTMVDAETRLVNAEAGLGPRLT